MVKRNKRSQKKTSLFKLTLVGFFSAFLLLAVFAAWFLLKNPKAENWIVNRHSLKVHTVAKKAAATTVSAPTVPQEPQFEFYTMLPQMEVDVPDDASQPKNTPTAQAPAKITPKPVANSAPTPVQPTDKEPSELSTVQLPEPLTTLKSTSSVGTPTHITYLLQAASFQEGADARRVQIHLSKLGFPAEIETVMIKGVAWHRVYVGPFTTLKAVQTARQQLNAKGISTVFVANDISDSNVP